MDYHQCCIIVGREEGQVTTNHGEICGPKQHSGKMAYTDYQGQGLFSPTSFKIRIEHCHGLQDLVEKERSKI